MKLKPFLISVGKTALAMAIASAFVVPVILKFAKPIREKLGV